MEAEYLLALPGARRGNLDRVPGCFAHPRYPHRLGVAHRTDRPQPAQREPGEHPARNRRRARPEVGPLLFLLLPASGPKRFSIIEDAKLMPGRAPSPAR